MTLTVDVFLVDAEGEMTLLDPPAAGADLAGFENFRTTVWGSAAVRMSGARFFPVLASGDLVVAPEDVAAFLRECGTLRANLDRVAAEAGREVVSTRLANIEAAARRALELGGGVLIG